MAAVIRQDIPAHPRVADWEAYPPAARSRLAVMVESAATARKTRAPRTRMVGRREAEAAREAIRAAVATEVMPRTVARRSMASTAKAELAAAAAVEAAAGMVAMVEALASTARGAVAQARPAQLWGKTRRMQELALVARTSSLVAEAAAPARTKIRTLEGAALCASLGDATAGSVTVTVNPGTRESQPTPLPKIPWLPSLRDDRSTEGAVVFVRRRGKCSVGYIHSTY